jgi:hypothetical protein
MRSEDNVTARGAGVKIFGVSEELEVGWVGG